MGNGRAPPPCGEGEGEGEGERHRPRGGWPGGQVRQWFKERIGRGRGTPKRSILVLCESLSASPQLSGFLPQPRPGPKRTRHVRRFRFVPAPHSCLGASPTGLSPSRLLTSALRWSCQSSAVVQSGRASGENHTLTDATSPAPVRPPEPPSRVAQSRRRRSLPHAATPRERAPRGQERRGSRTYQEHCQGEKCYLAV